MGIVSPSNHELLSNSIGFYVPAFLLFVGRMLNGFWILKRVQLDDWLMCAFFSVYTLLLILINVSARYATNLFPPEQEATIMADPNDVHSRIIGSKIVIPLEQCMLLSTWGVKTCLLIFLYRMSRQLPRTRLYLYILASYVALGYVVIMVCYYAIICRPFSQYWAMPVSNPQCATYSTYSKIQMVFNISSDIAIILLPCSILLRSKLPLKRKVLLIGLFSLGLFTILCAILNKYYNFASPQTTMYQLWYIRESSVAMWVANVICCWQLFQHMFHLRSFDDKHPHIAPENHHVELKSRSIGGHTKNSTWYARMIEKATHRPVDMNSMDGSMSGTTLQEDKRFFDPVVTENKTIFSIAREDEETDAGPALAFRHTHNIA